MNKLKQIPYGISDFKDIKENNYYYIDKTRYIETIENSPKYLFLIRPRRFGKSLFLSVLESYYDVYFKEHFNNIFKDTYIGTNPTGQQNKYLVLKFNFAEVDSLIENTKESFELHCRNVFMKFFLKYQSYFTSRETEAINEQPNGTAKLNTLFSLASFKSIKLYLIIDEYDNFTNSILANYGVSQYEDITRERNGFFKQFFNVIKAGTTGSGASLSKLFITGVSPITLDDVTSGGIGRNITTNFQFNEFIGFTGADVTEMLNYYYNAGKFNVDVDIAFQFMKKWYDNYRFTQNAGQSLFNSTMVLNFIEDMITEPDFPKQLLDDNTRIDYTKLKHLIILDKKLNGNFSVLKEIIENNQITAEIKSSFPVNKITLRDNFVSLLYYFGLLTIGGSQYDQNILKIPNESVKDIFTNYMTEGYEDADIFRIDTYEYGKLMIQMAYHGNWQVVFGYLSKATKAQSAIRDYISGESMVKGFLLAYLNLTNNYIITSEKELNKGYADLWLAPVVTTHAKANYSYLIELKYHKRTTKKKLNESLRELVKEAKTQLKKYETDPIIQHEKSTTKVKKLILVYNAWELAYSEEIE